MIRNFRWLCCSACNAQKRQPVASSLSETIKRDVSSNTYPNWSTFWCIWWVCSLPFTRCGKADNERILIFRDATMKNLLSLSNTWLVNGTFELSPGIFYQNFTMHVELHGFASPCVYVLLPNKTVKTYDRMIELLSEATDPNPSKVLADFEKVTLNAFSKKFPMAKISSCYFHLS